MSIPTIIGKPGVKVRGDAVRRDIFNNPEGAVLLPGGRIVDGSKSRDLTNTGDLFVIRAGKMLGLITASKKWSPSIIGALGVLHDTSVTANALTVPVAVAVELTRRQGSVADFKLTGPPVANDPVVTETVTPVSINVTTGVIDITGSSTTADFAIGSFVTPADGSETIRTILADHFGIRVIDEDAVDIDTEVMGLAIAGQIDTDILIDYPTDTALQAFVKAALRAIGGGYMFKDDFE